MHRPELVWDPRLAAAAEEWARHLASRDAGLQHSTGAERPGQGENLYWTSAGGALADGSQSWVDERKAYHGERIGEGDFESYGHYTQVCVCVCVDFFWSFGFSASPDCKKEGSWDWICLAALGEDDAEG